MEKTYGNAGSIKPLKVLNQFIKTKLIIMVNIDIYVSK